MPQPDQKPSLAGGIALVVLGLVILVPSGLCTGVFAFGPLIASILHPASPEIPQNGAWQMLPLALLIGAPFLFLGGAVLYAGIRHLRARNDRSE